MLFLLFFAAKYQSSLDLVFSLGAVHRRFRSDMKHNIVAILVLLIEQSNVMTLATYILHRGQPNRNAAGKVFVAEKAVAKPSNDRRLRFPRTPG